MASKGRKPVADSFSSSQPGYISVAGESFFLNLPTDSSNTLESTLFDDSLKGDMAFQKLFLGGKPKEEDPAAPFTQKEQTDVRRIFRAIFGVGILPTKKGISLPCSKQDLNLMLKALEIRRKTLIAEIAAYDTLASPDVHAKYSREHLIRLNKLIEEEIPTTLAPCKLTDVIDPNAPPRLPLDDTRMLRLLEIFAYLLAQGKDPLSEFQKTQPQPFDILPRMAVKDAPGLKEYEDAYAKANPHKVPEYTETLLKIKRVLQGDVSTGDATVDKQVQQAFEAIEKALGITDTKGSYSDRADRVIKRIAQMGEEKKADIAEIMKAKADLAKKQTEYDELVAKEKACQDALTKAKGEKTELEANLAKLTAELTAANDKVKTLEASLNAANASIKKLEEALAAATAAKAAAEKALAAAEAAKAAAETALAAANKAKEAAEAALAAATATIDALRNDLAAANAAKDVAEANLATANARIADLTAQLAAARAAEASAIEEKEALERQKEALLARIEDLKGDIRERDQRIAGLEADLLAARTQLNALLEVIPDLTPDRLRELVAAEGSIAGLNETIADLRRQLEACPDAEEFARLQARVVELERRPTQEAYDALRTQLQEQTDRADGLQPIVDRMRELERLLNDELTPERFAELLRASESVAGLRATIQRLEQRPDITEADLEGLRSQLRDAQALITELQKRPDITQEDYDALQQAHAAAKALITTLEKRAPITPEELQGLQDDLNTLVDKYEASVAELQRASDALDRARGIIARLEQEKAEIQRQLDAATAKLAECESIKTQLRETQGLLDAEKAKVVKLDGKILELEDKIRKFSGDATIIQGLRDQIAMIEAVRDKAVTDLTTAQGNVRRLQGELTTAIGERDARPTQEALAAMTAERDTAIGERDARPTQEALAAMTAERDTAIGERDARPTQEALAAVIAERDARPTAQQLKDMTAERNAAIAERNARPTQEALAEVAAARNAAITARDTLQARVATLEEQIRTGGVYKTVYTRLKEILGIRDGIDLPNEGQVDELLQSVQQRIQSRPAPQVNTSHLCLLNILYTLLRRLTIKQGITTDSGLRYTSEQVRDMFTSINGKSATPIDDSILKVFSTVLKKLLQTGIPRAGEFEIFSAGEFPTFAAVYSVLNHLLETGPFFSTDNKAVASAFLNQFFMNEYDFTSIYLQSNGRIKTKQDREDLGLVNLASLFLLVLTATQEILAKNQAVLETAGCGIPSVDFKPPAPVPAPVVPPVPRVSDEDERCKPGLVKGTTFIRRQMPSLVKFNKDFANNEPYLKELYEYLKQIKNSAPPVSPLCKKAVNMGASEDYIHQELMKKFEKPGVFRRGGTRKRTSVKQNTTKKIRKA